MDVFKYLQEDGESIAHRLNVTVAEFGQWPQDRLFEETKKAFSSLEGHFDKERMIVKNIDNSDVAVPLTLKAEEQIQAMKESIDSIVMIHIDEPGFRNALQALATKFNDHMSFCLDEYYTALRFSLSSADKAHVNAQFEQMVLS
ncbi:MAG: hypothetical protein WC028_09065 [Candidatus Obscuribacterales bacterium]